MLLIKIYWEHKKCRFLSDQITSLFHYNMAIKNSDLIERGMNDEKKFDRNYIYS